MLYIYITAWREVNARAAAEVAFIALFRYVFMMSIEL